MKELGNKLKDRRESMGYSHEEIAKLTSLNVVTIRKLEEGDLATFNDELTYVPYYLKNYCKILDIDYSELRVKLNDSIQSYTESIKITKQKEIKKVEENIKRSTVTYSNKQQKKSSNKLIFVFIFVVLILVAIAFFYFNKKQVSQPAVEVQQPVVKTVAETPKLVEAKKTEVVFQPKVNRVNITTFDVSIKETSQFEIVFGSNSWISFANSTINNVAERVYRQGEVIKVNVKPNDKLVIRMGYTKGNTFKINGIDFELTKNLNTTIPHTFTVNFKGV